MRSMFVAGATIALACGVVRGEAPQYVATVLSLPGTTGTARAIAWGQQVGSAGGRALGWSASPQSVVDLTPASGYIGAFAEATDGISQAGWGVVPVGTVSYAHAVLWHGTAESIVDLHPAGFDNTYARGVGGGQQVGTGQGPGGHALLWRGSPQSVVDLHPGGTYLSSEAWDTDGVRQVGWANVPHSPISEAGPHAMVWQGTAASARDLNPAGSLSSEAFGIDGDKVAGWAEFGLSKRYATIWDLADGTALPLNPSWAYASKAFAVAGAFQAGEAELKVFPNLAHAVVWNGSAESAVDLHAFLPPELRDGIADSQAFGVDDLGNAVGVARGPTGGQYAVLWTRVPEPSAAGVILVAALIAGQRRWRRGRGGNGIGAVAMATITE